MPIVTPLHARFTHVALSTLTLAGSSLTAYGQQYLPPETPARREMVQDNPFMGGQPSDLQFEVVSVEYIGPPCSTGEKKILEGAKVKVKVGWKKSQSYFGVMATQAEGSDTTNGDDSIVFEIEGHGRWNLVGVKRDGTDALGGASPEGEQGGAGTWNGVRLTPPSSFESGQYGSGAAGDPTTMTYELNLTYTPQPQDGCECFGFLLRGRYLHTYDGSFKFWFNNSISVAVGYPWSVSIGGEISFTNDHAWNKQLVNPTSEGDGSHTAEYAPGAEWVPKEECCGKKEVAIGDVDVPMTTTEPTTTPTIYNQTVTVVGNGLDETLDYTVDLIITTPDGFEISRVSKVFTGACADGCDVSIPFAMDANYPYESFGVEVIARGERGLAGVATSVGSFAPIAAVPTIESSSIPGYGVLGEFDTLLAHVAVAGWSPEDAAAKTNVYVFSSLGVLVDQEPGVWSGMEEWPIALPTLPRGSAGIVGDGILSVRRGDSVVVELSGDMGGFGESIEVVRALDSVNRPLAKQPPCGANFLTGEAMAGGPVQLEIQFAGKAPRVVTVPVEPGMSASAVNTAVANALRANGVKLSVLANGAIRVTGPNTLTRCRVNLLNQGLDLRAQD
jgi:hypothetical protein